MQTKIEIKNGTPNAQSRCEVAFRLTRSDFTVIRVLDATGNPSKGKAQLPGNGRLWLLFDAPIAVGSSIFLSVDYSAPELPAVQKTNWGTPKDDAIDQTALLPFTQIDPSLLFMWDFYRSLVSWDLFLIQEPNAKRRNFKCFFRALDLETNPSLQFATEIADAEKKEKLDYVMDGLNFMRAHQNTRLQALIWGTELPVQQLPHEKTPDTANYISGLMLPIYRTFFSQSDGTLDGAAIAEAYCLFANGELRRGTTLDQNPWNCEPDSAMELHFANFCLFAILSGVDVKEWTAILPCVAASQEYFIRTYRPQTPPPYLISSYGPANYTSSVPLTDADIAAIYARYKAMSLQQISNQINVNLRTLLVGVGNPALT